MDFAYGRVMTVLGSHPRHEGPPAREIRFERKARAATPLPSRVGQKRWICSAARSAASQVLQEERRLVEAECR